MEIKDKSSVIFGNQIDQKTIKKGLKNKNKFIKKYGGTDKPFWQYQIGTRQHDTWAGLAFEQLCLNHHRQIEQALGIAGVITNVYSWSTPQAAEEKAQIDLIIKSRQPSAQAA